MPKWAGLGVQVTGLLLNVGLPGGIGLLIQLGFVWGIGLLSKLGLVAGTGFPCLKSPALTRPHGIKYPFLDYLQLLVAAFVDEGACRVREDHAALAGAT